MVTDIREWLKRKPVAASARCTCSDGVTRTVRIDQSDKQRFVRAEEAIEAMGAVALEALDPKGNSIRLCELKAKEDGAPITPRAESQQQSDLAHFASLVSRAYEQGAKSAEAPTKLAFETMGQLMQLVMARLANVEAQQIRQLNAAAKAAAAAEKAIAEGATEEGLLETMVSQFLGGQAMARLQSAGAEAAPNGATKAGPHA